MIDPNITAQLESLGLVLERMEFASSSGRVVVGVRDAQSNRWLGHAANTPHDPSEGLGEAYEDALRQFNPDWRKCLEKALV